MTKSMKLPSKLRAPLKENFSDAGCDHLARNLDRSPVGAGAVRRCQPECQQRCDQGALSEARSRLPPSRVPVLEQVDEWRNEASREPDHKQGIHQFQGWSRWEDK